ncbi:MAG: hypothetical protein K2L49_05350 [Muribaculaceae bacterium]|nr:hypothetical protein [Muribaculaceae bacterium]
MKKQICILLMAIIAIAATPVKAEDHMAEITLNSGETMSGKIKKWWFGPFKTSVNTDMSVMDADGVEHKYNAADISSFVMDGDQIFETSYIAIPALFKSGRILHWILGVEKKSDNAVIYWHNSYTSNSTRTAGTGSMPSRHTYSTGIVTTYSFKCAGDSIAYPFYFPGNGDVNFAIFNAHLKKTQPELVEYVKNYFKEHKQAKKELKDNPSLMLDIYDEYLLTRQ